jgi:hypothetical protein
MKKLIILFLLIASVAKAGSKDSMMFKKYEPVNKINLHLNASGHNYHEDNSQLGTVFLVGGLAFITAAILEGNANYTTYSNSGSYHSSSTTKPFWQQTPRQIMLVTGIGFTLTGGLLMIRK